MFLKLRVAAFMLLSLLFSFSVYSNDDENSLTKALTNADALRRTDPSAFFKEIENLSSNQSSFTPYQKFYFYYLNGYAKAFSGDVKGSIEYYNLVIQNTRFPILAYRAAYSAANVHSLTRNWQQGIIELQKVLELSSEVSDKSIREQGIIVAAAFYNQLEQYELALNFATQLIDNNVSSRNLCMTLQVKIEALLNLKLLSGNEDLIQSAISSCEQVNERVISSFIKVNFAQFLIENDQHKEAFDFLNENINSIVLMQYKRLVAEAYALLSQGALGIGRYDVAEEKALLALDMANGFPISKPTVQAYWTLKEVFSFKKQYEEAFRYQIKYAEAERGVTDERAEKQLAFELAKQKVQEKNHQISLLNEQNTVLQLEQQLTQQQAKNNRMFTYMLIAVVASILLWVYSLKRNQVKLRKLAEFDGLTGLNNRRHFNESAESVLKYCEGEGQDASFILFDLDKFKSINDTYGHQVGDWVLKNTAQVIKKQGRKYDLIGRVGGEEFAILLPACDLQDGEQFAEQCRQAIAGIDSTESGFKFDISASFGVTHCKLSGYELKQLMYDSDMALYQAKDTGRNKVVSCQPKASDNAA